MSACITKCGRIRHIVQLRQLLRRWRQKAALRSYNSSSITKKIPTDVPSGHVAVVVGNSGKRYIVRASHLNHPIFKKLLVQAEEEYGFGNNHGPLAIPCDESLFEEILRFLSRSDSSNSSRFFTLDDFQRHCNARLRSTTALDFWSDSRPLLNGPCDKSIW
ncbi:hypothetical protein MKW98_013178 [Papaver atlanticum]|uniref:Uncharacterized protein n=1 Tax=Papaver atlanticum TaxID=357466 RepID=A0AAD4T5U9_9MAGN|nr:hypothetical protein MKW98_013178 [Papaver atlanticum]